MKRELIIGIMLAVVCGLSVKDVLDAIRCRKREEELSLRLQVGLSQCWCDGFRRSSLPISFIDG